MSNNHPYQHHYSNVRPALLSKVEELKMQGLDHVNEKELWNYLIEKKWKKPMEEIRIYQIVNDILAVNSSQFMTFVTVEAYKAPNIFNKLSEEELKELLS